MFIFSINANNQRNHIFVADPGKISEHDYLPKLWIEILELKECCLH